MSRATVHTAHDEQPRLIVIIPVIAICIGSILLLILSKRPVHRQFAAPQNQADASPATPDSQTASAAAIESLSSKDSPRPRGSAPVQRKPILPSDTTPAPRSPIPPWTGPEPGASPVTAASTTGGLLPYSQGIEVRGRVKLEGTPPQEIRIDMTSDPQCDRLHTAPVTTRHYVVDAEGGLANVLVYVKSGLSGDFPVPAGQPLLNQTGCFYEPYVIGVMARQKFRIRNSDPLVHNVHATPKVNKEFNFAQPIKGQVEEKRFDKPEVLVRFKCDVHPWMFAYVGVVAHPFYAVTGTDGTFLLPPDLPPGTYTLEAVHPKVGSATQEIVVNTGERKTVDFTLRVPAS